MDALLKIQKAGFDVTLVDGFIEISPASRLTEQQLTFLKSHKAEIISELQKQQPIDDGKGNPGNPENNTHGELIENIREQIEERAAIMEYDGGLSRHDAEQEAVKAIRVYCYRTKEKPDSELVAIMPNTSLAEAHESLSLRYGDKLLAVYENTPNLAGILAKPTQHATPVHIKILLARAVDKIEILCEQNGAITGAPTVVTDIEELTGGLQTGHSIIVTDTSVMDIAVDKVLRSYRPVLVFSMGIPGDLVAMRIMSSLGCIDQYKVITGKLEDDDWPRLTSAINLLAGTELFIDDSPMLTDIEIGDRARQLARENGQLGLIVVDYDDKKDKQLFELSEILKALAKDLYVPVFVSQFNRKLEK
jgi:hypothetical protein